VAGFAQNAAGFLGAKLFERRPPLQIPGAGHRIRLARDFPTTDMPAAHGEAKFLGCGRAEPQDPIRQPLCVKQFTRVGNAVDGLEVRVVGVFLIEAVPRGLETSYLARLKCFRHT
jgi:hypothetical protein